MTVSAACVKSTAAVADLESPGGCESADATRSRGGLSAEAARRCQPGNSCAEPGLGAPMSGPGSALLPEEGCFRWPATGEARCIATCRENDEGAKLLGMGSDAQVGGFGQAVERRVGAVGREP